MKEMREKFLPFLRKCINPLDDDGAPLGDNFIMSEFLRYGVRDARTRNPAVRGARRQDRRQDQDHDPP